MMVDIRKVVSNALMILLFVVLSTPIVFTMLFPAWMVDPYSVGNSWPLYGFMIIVRIFAVFGPWILFAMATVFYRKGMKTRAFASGMLFVWVAILQIGIILTQFMYYHRVPYFHPYW